MGAAGRGGGGGVGKSDGRVVTRSDNGRGDRVERSLGDEGSVGCDGEDGRLDESDDAGDDAPCRTRQETTHQDAKYNIAWKDFISLHTLKHI